MITVERFSLSGVLSPSIPAARSFILPVLARDPGARERYPSPSESALMRTVVPGTPHPYKKSFSRVGFEISDDEAPDSPAPNHGHINSALPVTCVHRLAFFPNIVAVGFFGSNLIYFVDFETFAIVNTVSPHTATPTPSTATLNYPYTAHIDIKGNLMFAAFNYLELGVLKSQCVLFDIADISKPAIISATEIDDARTVVSCAFLDDQKFLVVHRSSYVKFYKFEGTFKKIIEYDFFQVMRGSCTRQGEKIIASTHMSSDFDLNTHYSKTRVSPDEQRFVLYSKSINSFLYFYKDPRQENKTVRKTINLSNEEFCALTNIKFCVIGAEQFLCIKIENKIYFISEKSITAQKTNFVSVSGNSKLEYFVAEFSGGRNGLQSLLNGPLHPNLTGFCMFQNSLIISDDRRIIEIPNFVSPFEFEPPRVLFDATAFHKTLFITHETDITVEINRQGNLKLTLKYEQEGAHGILNFDLMHLRSIAKPILGFQMLPTAHPLGRLRLPSAAGDLAISGALPRLPRTAAFRGTVQLAHLMQDRG